MVVGMEAAMVVKKVVHLVVSTADLKAELKDCQMVDVKGLSMVEHLAA